MLLLTQMFHNFLHMAQPKKAFPPSIFGKDATACVRERRMSSFYIISMVMMGRGWLGRACTRVLCVCARERSNKILRPILQLHFIALSLLSHSYGIWEHSGHPRSAAFAGVTHYQKPLPKGPEYLQKEKEAGETGIHGRMFLFLGSLYNCTQQSLPCSSDALGAESSMHIYGIRGQLCLALSREGGSVCADVVYLQGVGVAVQISEGGVDEIQAYWGFYNRESQQAEGMAGAGGKGGRGQIKKIYISFIALPLIERTFCWGDVCQRLLIQFVPPVLFLNPSADFIPGML